MYMDIENIHGYSRQDINTFEKAFKPSGFKT